MNDLDWNRLRSGDNRALDPDHQDVFDLVAEQRAEIERLRESADAAHKVADDLEAELERLRELFRWIGNSTGDPAVLATVREALGE